MFINVLNQVPYQHAATAAAKLLQSCPTLCDPIDGRAPGSPIPEILQARTLEWVAISFFNSWKWKVKLKSFSHVRLLATPWTAAFQAPPSIGFSRQEYWSGVPSTCAIIKFVLNQSYWVLLHIPSIVVHLIKISLTIPPIGRHNKSEKSFLL